MEAVNAAVETSFTSRPISPFVELGAYESLWVHSNATFPRIAARFRANPGAVPSDFVDENVARSFAAKTIDHLERRGVKRFGVRVHGAGEYPCKLRDAKNPVELLYFQGYWPLVSSRSVAVVGTRQPSKLGIKRARKLVKLLVEADFTVVSGLAQGIDTVTHTTALAEGGRTFAVIGTPICEAYPKENKKLQEKLATEYLVISQIPILRYSQQDYRRNRAFFPERNVTMSALSLATVIVEAGETSGTLRQARAAIAQKRKLFILDSCFRDKALTWPEKFLAKGAIRVTDFDDILANLETLASNEQPPDEN